LKVLPVTPLWAEDRQNAHHSYPSCVSPGYAAIATPTVDSVQSANASLQQAIADEATTLHLDKQQPWAAQLYDAWKETIGQFTPPRTDIPAVNQQWQNTRQHILWKAYFSRTATAEARVALLKQKRDQYKIQVQDPDFFKQLGR